MKPLLVTLIIAVSGVCAAHQAPRHVRVSMQWIEISHPILTGLMGGEKKSGAALHDAVIAYSKEGKARIIETGIVVCRSGQKAVIESISEEIFPTEYEPPGSLYNTPPMNPAIRSFYAFETRNTGVTLEVEPTMTNLDGLIDLRIATDVITRARHETLMEHKDQWGDASLRMPVFEVWRTYTSVILTNGTFELVSVISPKPTLPTPAVQNKILKFVRADVLPVSH